MSRISQAFTKPNGEGRRGFIPFIMAGDPDLATTYELLLVLADCGATIIELGVPFSDPVADGPVIQRASEGALRHGFGIGDVLALVTRVREKTSVPIVLFSYYNPLLQYGLKRLSADASRAGLDGVLVTDLVPEEAKELLTTLKANGLDAIFLAAPTSTDARLRMVAEHSSGFIYAVSRPGVTGARSDLSDEAERLVSRLRQFSDLPIAVGFGISSASQIKEVWRYADGAVVGSAIVTEIETQAAAPDIVRRVAAFTRALLPEKGDRK